MGSRDFREGIGLADRDALAIHLYIGKHVVFIGRHGKGLGLPGGYCGRGGIHRTAFARDSPDLIGSSAGIGSEGSLNGMRHVDTLEGIAADGAHIFSINHHGGNFIARVRRDGEGTAGTLFHRNRPFWGNGAICTSGRCDCGVQGRVVCVQLGVIDPEHSSILPLIHKGKADGFCILELSRQVNPCLASVPIGIYLDVVPQIPQICPSCTAVHAALDQQIMIPAADIIQICIVIEDHVDLGILPGDVQIFCDEPFVLLVCCVVNRSYVC